MASKGLDFPAIQHVINYDMPEEIENYGENMEVDKKKKKKHGRNCCMFEINFCKFFFLCLIVHRIGRTGRSGKTGIATTFINKGCGEKQTLSPVIFQFIYSVNAF